MDPRLAQMSRTTEILVGIDDLNAVLQTLAVRAREVTGADLAALSTFDAEGKVERFMYDGMDAEVARKLGPPPSGRGLLGVLARQSTPLRIPDATLHPSYTGVPDGHPSVGPFLGVPIRAAGRAIGSIYVVRTAGRAPFGEMEEASASFLALQAATAVWSALSQSRASRLALLEERASIAHDLHDGLIQSLYGLGLAIDTHAHTRALAPDTTELLRSSVDRINDLISDIRSYITILEASAPHSVPDLSRDLPFAARQLVPPGIDTVLHLSAAALKGVGARAAEDMLYIAREAISNAVRHGSPSKIGVDLRDSDSELALTIQDNGVGFDRANARSGLGMVSMRTRADRLGANLDIVSIPGMGTMVRVSIPRSDDEPGPD